MRRMIRTRETFAEGLATQMKAKGLNKKSLAEKLNVTPNAISFWLKGTIPKRSTLKLIETVLNLKLIETEIVTPCEAAMIQEQINEQTFMSFDEPDDEPEDSTEEEPETETDPKWRFLYKTNNPGVYKGSDSKNVYYLVEQRVASKRDSIPFVLNVMPKEADNAE